MPASVAALIVGNEILTGKVRDENAAFLARELFAMGVELRRVIFCADDVPTIVADVRALRSAADYVITSGGVGPTHDDVTIEAVAKALERPLTRSEELEGMLREFYKGRITSAHLRMADVPEGTELLRSGRVPWPVLYIDRVFVFPGVPELFRLKFDEVRERLGGGQGFTSHAIYTRVDEGDIADLLTSLQRAHPAVTIGSYVRWRSEEYTTKLTFDGRDPEEVARVADAFVAALPAGSFVRREP